MVARGRGFNLKAVHFDVTTTRDETVVINLDCQLSEI